MAESTRMSTALQIGTSALIALATTSTMLYVSGNQEVTGDLTVQGNVVQSGGLVPLVGAFSLSEVSKFASGALAITNPTTKTLLCTTPVIDVATNSSPATKFDVYAGTGSVGTGDSRRGYGSGSIVIADNITTSVRTISMTGSSIVYTESGSLAGTIKIPKFFKLYGNTETTKVNRINIISLTQTGSGISGTYFVPCYFAQ